jgi:hypothetical protein
MRDELGSTSYACRKVGCNGQKHKMSSSAELCEVASESGLVGA